MKIHFMKKSPDRRSFTLLSSVAFTMFFVNIDAANCVCRTDCACSSDGIFFTYMTTDVVLESTIRNTDTLSRVISCNGRAIPTHIGAFVVTKRPSHGIAGVNSSLGSPGFAYKPSQNFVGKDHFELNVDVSGDAASGIKHPMKINVDVNVIN